MTIPFKIAAEQVDVPGIGKRECFTDPWLTGKRESWDNNIIKSKVNGMCRKAAILLMLEECRERLMKGYEYLYSLQVGVSENDPLSDEFLELDTQLTNLEFWHEDRQEKVWRAYPEERPDGIPLNELVDDKHPVGSPLRPPDAVQLAMKL